MNWGEFKKKVEEAGVTDDMKISWIDVDDCLYLQVKIEKSSKWFSVS